MECKAVLFAVAAWCAAASGAPSHDDKTRELLAALEGADRLRVRSGGTCHRNAEHEKTLFEVSGAEAVKAAAERITINDTQSGFHCMCCGDPTLEFYRGETLIAMLGYHHGRSIRWPDEWKDDALLTPESARSLATWMAENGVTAPGQELDEGEAQAAAARRRGQAYMRILPEATIERFRKIKSEEDIAPAFRKGAKGAALAAMCLRVLGCHFEGWEWLSAYEVAVIDEVLPALRPEQVQAAIDGVIGPESGDEEGIRGAARWVLYEAKWEGMEPAKVAAALPTIAPEGLSHPDEETRRRVLWVLWKIGTPEARAALRAVVEGKVLVRTLPPEEAVHPGGRKSLRSKGEKEKVEAERDETVAAVYLSRLRDTESLPSIKALVESASAADRPLLEEAVKSLEP